MSRFVPTALAFLLCTLVAALTGCSKTKTVIDLKADGSGTLTFNIAVEKPKLEKLLEQAAAFGFEAGNVDDMLDFAKTGKALAHIEGVRLVSQKSLDDAEKEIRGTEMTVAFDSLEALAKSGLVPGLNTELKKGEDGNYTLIMEFKLAGMDQLDLSSPDTQQMFEMQKEAMRPTIGGFAITDIVKLPTAPIETNGTKAETGGHSVMWSVNFENADLSKLKRTVTFSGEGLDWKPFKVTAGQAKKVMGAARSKVGDASGPAPLPGTPAELEVRIAAAKAAVEAHEQAVQAAQIAAKQARAAAAEADRTVAQQTAELDQAKGELAKLIEALEKLKAPAGPDDK